jgi:hypothetical protein
VGEQAALHRRGPVGAGTLWFASACLVLSLCLFVLNAAGVGALGVRTSQSDGTVMPAHATVNWTNRLVNAQSRPTVPETTRPTTAPAPPAATQVTTSPSASAPPTPPPPPEATQLTPPPAPAPPPPAPAPPPPPAPPALPGRGSATTYGCAAALTYLAAYSAPGFTFQCPGSALGHEAMTCIDEPGVCDNEHLIAIADPCPAAYMNEASNSWTLTGASSAPIDPYGACP